MNQPAQQDMLGKLLSYDPVTRNQDEKFMAMALEEAHLALQEDEVPVGAIVVHKDQIVGTGRNSKEKSCDPTAHAELVAIRQASLNLGRWRLNGCRLFVTMEPCPMCTGAMLSARVERLVFGCPDPKAGAAVSLYNLTNDARLNHRIEVTGGIYGREAAELLQAFFKNRRDRCKALKIRSD